MLPSHSGILAEAINTKILTKNHPPTLILCISTPIPRILTLIPRIPTLIPRIPTLIPRVPVIPHIPFPDSPFRLLQIVIFF